MENNKTLTCDCCGKDFYVNSRTWTQRRSDKKIDGKNIYCSIDCRLSARGHSPSIIVKCSECSKDIVRTQSELKRTKLSFCSCECSGFYHGREHPQMKKTKICSNCDTLIQGNRKYCPKCITKGKHLKGGFTAMRTLGEELEGRKKDANRYNNIRGHAREVMKLNLQKCFTCPYDKHVEVCHIKAIKDFSLDTLISEINHRDNLVLLCRNCHWELDHGLLDLSKVRTGGLEPPKELLTPSPIINQDH